VDLDKYTELSGVTVRTSQKAKVNATIRRTKAKLETMLGFALKPKNLYTEKGKVQFEGFLPMIDELDNLLPPDEEEGVYKLFPYSELDRYFHIDPFTNIYKVKLVMPTNDGEFVTITDLDNVVAQYGRDNIGKYIERYWEWFTWEWYRTWRYRYSSSGEAGLMLAVEADWLDCYPDDLQYLWVDMISYYSDPNYSVSGSLRSESVDGHSWSRGFAGGGKDGDSSPEDNPNNRLLLSRYAGPFGSVLRNPVR
jgi:hypothetical protein